MLHREGNLQRFFSQQREEKRCETIVLAMCYRHYNILLCILLVELFSLVVTMWEAEVDPGACVVRLQRSRKA